MRSSAAKKPRQAQRRCPVGHQVTMPWAAVEARPVPIDATARAGAAKVGFLTRWTPKHVWTLHVVPGRLNGPPLAVKRRVLSEEEGFLRVETPGGDASVSCEDLSSPERDGRARSLGSSRFKLREEPPPSGCYGLDLAIEVFDHKPTLIERERWSAVRRRLSAMLAKLPRHAYLASPTEDGAYLVEKVQIRRMDGYGDISSRFDLEYRRGKGEWTYTIGAPDLSELAEQGWSSVGARLDGVRLYLDHPPQTELDELGREHTERQAQDAKYTREARDFAEGIGRAWEQAQRQTTEQQQALDSFGLKPGCSDSDVQRAFRQRVASERVHPDQGGDGQRFNELTRLRDEALKAVSA